MIPAIFTFWAMSLAPGYLAGSVYKEMKESSEMLPALTAIFPPLAAVIAVMVLIETEKGN